MFYNRSGDWDGGGNKPKQCWPFKVGSVYGGWGLGRYTGLDKKYVNIVICRATCDGIDEVIGADIHWSIFDAQALYPMLLRNFFDRSHLML
jgi:hypothetical protein